MHRAALLLLLVMAPTAGRAETLKQVRRGAPGQRVFDQASVLSKADRQKLQTRLVSLEKTHLAQGAVVLLRRVEGDTIVAAVQASRPSAPSGSALPFLLPIGALLLMPFGLLLVGVALMALLASQRRSGASFMSSNQPNQSGGVWHCWLSWRRSILHPDELWRYRRLRRRNE